MTINRYRAKLIREGIEDARAAWRIFTVLVGRVPLLAHVYLRTDAALCRALDGRLTTTAYFRTIAALADATGFER
jgi:hypothetical protein